MNKVTITVKAEIVYDDYTIREGQTDLEVIQELKDELLEPQNLVEIIEFSTSTEVKSVEVKIDR